MKNSNSHLKLLKRNFNDLSDYEIGQTLIKIYTNAKNSGDLEIDLGLITEFPGLEFLTGWARSGFSQKFLDEHEDEENEEKFSEGMKRLIKMPLIEQNLFGVSE
jgi:hypothetical protein